MRAALSFLKRLMTSSSIFLFSESIRVLRPNLSYLKLTRRLNRLDFLQHFKSGAMSFSKHHLSCILLYFNISIFFTIMINSTLRVFSPNLPEEIILASKIT